MTDTRAITGLATETVLKTDLAHVRCAFTNSVRWPVPSRAWIGGLVLGLIACFSPGCEQKTVAYNSFLSGLPGAEQRLPLNRNMGDYSDPTRMDESKLIVEETKDKKKKLIAKTGRHMMIHLYNTVDSGNAELFVNEVLSEMTKREYFERGVDPRDGFKILVQNQEDLQILFSRMPAGEMTPGIFARPMGNGVQRVELDGLAARGLYWTGFDMVTERGNWRLRWMVGPQVRD